MDVLYSYVERLQDTKADKENVASEMNVKADKEALDSKVSVATFDNTFTLLDEGLKEALHKMDDYMNEELALKQALRQLSLDMSEKMDGQAFQALQQYLGERRRGGLRFHQPCQTTFTTEDGPSGRGSRNLEGGGAGGGGCGGFAFAPSPTFGKFCPYLVFYRNVHITDDEALTKT